MSIPPEIMKYPFTYGRILVQVIVLSIPLTTTTTTGCLLCSYWIASLRWRRFFFVSSGRTSFQSEVEFRACDFSLMMQSYLATGWDRPIAPPLGPALTVDLTGARLVVVAVGRAPTRISNSHKEYILPIQWRESRSIPGRALDRPYMTKLFEEKTLYWRVRKLFERNGKYLYSWCSQLMEEDSISIQKKQRPHDDPI